MLTIDIGFVIALRQEAVGILDRLKRARTTRGNGWTFYTGTLGDHTVALVISGVGQQNAEKATNILLDVFAPTWIYSAGYAGGLSSRLKQSNICVPEQVIRASDNKTLDLSSPIPKQTIPMPNMLTLLTVNDVVGSPEDKKKLFKQTGAELVDMETFAVAEVCRIREVPFCSVRVILDAAEDLIPKDIVKILESMDKGVSRFSGTILGGILFRPSVVLDLVSLKQRAFHASERLAQFIIAEQTRRKSDEPIRGLLASNAGK